ncbi:MAG: hypothetical protein AAB152_04900 [Candidatus Coatesbacteria bacterium]
MITVALLIGGMLAGGANGRAATPGEVTVFEAAAVRGNALLAPMDARRTGLGEAFVAAGDDGSAAGNPAGLGQVTRPGVFGSYHRAGSAYNATHAGVAVPLGPGTLAAGFSYFDLGRPDLRDADGWGLSPQSFYDYALFLGWGMANPGWTGIPGWMGVSVEAVQEGVGGAAEAVTFGEVVPLGDKLKAGVMVEHLGVKLDGYALPSAGRIGAVYQVAPTLDGAVDVRYGFTDRQTDLAVGFEAFRDRALQLRAGYRVQSPSLGAGSMAGLSFGVGARWKGFHLDYAFQSYGDIGSGQFVTLGWGGR